MERRRLRRRGEPVRPQGARAGADAYPRNRLRRTGLCAGRPGSGGALACRPGAPASLARDAGRGAALSAAGLPHLHRGDRPVPGGGHPDELRAVTRTVPAKVWLWSRFAGFGDHNHTFAVGTACGGLRRPAHPSMQAEKWAASSSVASSGSTAETYWSGRTTTTAPEREISRVSKISSPGPAA